MKNPLIPMCAITGNPTREKIEEMLTLYQEVGIEQMLIYPRSGCEVEYMSARWIEVCRDIIEGCEKRNITVWLYDEFNWPSGNCSGAVMRDNPEFYSVAVAVEDGKCVMKRFDAYSDILNPDAMDSFIEKTHEVYYRHFGKYFGNVIAGVFTDEPDFRMCTSGGGKYPYTKNLELIYREKCGRDLFSDMIDNFSSEEAKLSYWSTLKELFHKNYVKRLADWCESHGVVLTGHTMRENDISQAIMTCGNTVSALRGFGLPGLDDIDTHITVDKHEWLTFGAAESAIRHVGNGGLAELFAYGPCDNPPARLLQMFWLCAMFGIDHYVLAVAQIDARGNYGKKSWYHPTNYTSPWFSGYRELGECAKVAASYARRDTVVEVAVRYPATETAKKLYTDEATVTNDRIYALLRALIRNQYQWRIIDENDECPEGAYLVEITSEPEWSLENVMTNLEEKVERKVLVYENGTLADDLFVRRYKDGSYLILDLRDSDRERNIVISVQGTEYSHILAPRACYASTNTPVSFETVISSPKCEFSVTLDSPNTLRANLHKDSPEFVFNALSDINGVSIAKRNYFYDGEIYLDGVRINADKPCKTLKKGFSELYLSTDTFTLKKGTHKITVSKFAESEMYLPTCIITGDFASDSYGNISIMPTSVSEGQLENSILYGYVGKIQYETKILIPDECSALRFESSELYTRLYLDGEYIDGLLTDFVFDIPSKYLGKETKVKIEQFTSIAGMFGNAELAIDSGEANGDDYINTLYKKFPYGKYKKCGVKNLRFVKK